MSRPLRHFLLTNFNVVLPGSTCDRAGEAVRTQAWLEQRFELFERFCRPSVEAQTCREFEWIVRYESPADDHLRRRLEALPAQAGVALHLVPGAISFRQAVAARLDARDRWVLTTRLDNDDALCRRALAIVQDAARHTPADLSKEFFDLRVGYCVSHPELEVRRLDHPQNQFVSLLEQVDEDGLDPSGSSPRTARCVAASRVHEVAPVRVVSVEPCWLEVVHARNRVNRLRGERVVGVDLRAEFGVRVD